MPQVLISLGAFGAAEVRRHGQLYFTRVSAQAGADGVEVRGELLVDPATELPALARAVRELGLACVYSSPEGLWSEGGALDTLALARAIESAQALGVPRLKMSIGGFAAPSDSTFPELARRLERAQIELVIENDQTVAAGTIPPLARFFRAADAAGLPLGMTFDLGNWHFLGECPQEAARVLGARVRYVHCKGVQRRPDKWVAVPIADSAAPWRTVLRALPAGQPWAIEYPLVGDDLLAVTRGEIAQLRAIAATQGEAG
jgi:sugar phosphate isomerase/epimerase